MTTTVEGRTTTLRSGVHELEVRESVVGDGVVIQSKTDDIIVIPAHLMPDVVKAMARASGVPQPAASSQAGLASLRWDIQPPTVHKVTRVQQRSSIEAYCTCGHATESVGVDESSRAAVQAWERNHQAATA